mmetsp:Transcript_41981/g.135816  ORF Transcript_41981/g.135816 Transcript_41981/m.135816 type:complete len:210 (-) Transcript_41981:2626-3255(-)
MPSSNFLESFTDSCALSWKCLTTFSRVSRSRFHCVTRARALADTSASVFFCSTATSLPMLVRSSTVSSITQSVSSSSISMSAAGSASCDCRILSAAFRTNEIVLSRKRPECRALFDGSMARASASSGRFSCTSTKAPTFSSSAMSTTSPMSQAVVLHAETPVLRNVWAQLSALPNHEQTMHEPVEWRNSLASNSARNPEISVSASSQRL